MKKQIIKILFLFLVGFLFVENAWCAGSRESKMSKGTQYSPSVKVDYSDVSLFYSVIEKAQREGKEITGEYMYKNYVQQSSDGLKNGYAKNRSDVFPIKDGVIDYAVYDKKIKPLLPFFIKNKNIFMNQKPLDGEDIERISENMCAFLGQELCLYLENKTVYFSISAAFNMGGTAFEQGVFIDVSMIYDTTIDYTKHPDISQNFAKNNLIQRKNGDYLATHEFFHTLQMLAYKDHFAELQKQGDLKTISLIEGAAEFFVMNVKEKLPVFVHNQEKYMKKNPQKYLEFWGDAQNKAHDETAKKKWFFNRSTKEIQNSVYPADLGYYIGQRIIQKFFEEEIKTRSRDTVLRQILRSDIPDARIEKIVRELSKGM